ncbi:unnamed protein product [Paramecium sonneborni]|uniref:Uncharacterized protein n=1 Tax=Paramecium sonneborni TaxID=65129 RepID=A0A8S1R3W8_9CILI|nr:unnamed protein product [Paramecium sonneborni]
MMLDKTKLKGCWSINRNWTIKNQILGISSIISSLISLILLVSIWLSQRQIYENLKSVSEEIFIRQTSQQINNIWIHQRSLEQMIFYTKEQIQTIRILYKQFDHLIHHSNQNFKFESPKMCLNNRSDLDSYCFQSSTTCGIFGTNLDFIKDEESRSIIATTFTLTSFRITLDHTQNNDAQFFCITTGAIFPQQFKPNERPYYIEFKKYINQDTQNDSIYFASPFKMIAGFIRIPIMTSLVNQFDQIVGMVAKDIDFTYASIAKSQNSNTVLYVIDHQGKIFQSIIYNQINLTVYYFNETNVTGFNQKDFQQLMNQHNNVSFENDCPHLQSDIFLCRFNKKSKQYQIIKSSKIQDSPLILVVLLDTNSIIKQSNDNLFLIYQSQIELAQQITLYLIVIPIGIIIFSNILTYMIFRQFKYLLNLIKQKIFTNKKELFFNPFEKTKQIFNSSCVTNLIHASIQKFNNLESEGKSRGCLTQEKINYPRNIHTQMKIQQKFVLVMQFFNQNLENEQETKNTIFDSTNKFIFKQNM